MQILRCDENDSPPQREEGLGVVGGIGSERQPPNPSLQRRGIIN